MLTQIDLKHFKCFKVLKLPLRSLTLLSGANASGKSSVLQALALLHQTMREHEWSSRLMLNGATIQLGTTTDVIDQVHGRHNCEIALLNEEAYYQWEFSGERGEMSMEAKRIRIDGQEGEISRLKYLLPESCFPCSLTRHLLRLTYLTAERLGPREYYKLNDPRLTPVVGPRGEHAVSVLHSARDTRVPLDSLIVQDVASIQFNQVEAWMKHFFPECVLEIGEIKRANAVTLGIRMSSDTDFHRPVHTGFGLTQVLPIVVAALSTNRNDLLLIENPEVHLHPAGQAAMGGFLARIAAAGAQVIIETHSDHVLNGIRRAVKDRTLPKEDVALHFFRPRRENTHDQFSQVEYLMLDTEGNIDRWPEGFFDQFDKDINYFAGWD